MLTDVDKEFDTPLEDENGELIEVIELEEVFTEEDTGLEDKDDSFYELAEDDITQEVEEFNSIEEDIVEAKENYEEAKQQLVDIFTSILEAGEITAEDNVNIEQLKEQYSESYNDVKEKVDNNQTKTLEERLEELKEGFVGASPDEILNILTENGTKCWLYKDDDDNVLIDGTSIPELTVLVNKFKMIATDGENEGEFTLNPNFIKMVVKDTGTGDAVKSIDNMYYLSTSKYELIGGTWVSILPTSQEQQGKFLWIKTVTTYMDTSKEPTETQPICVSSQDGENGADGVDGKDGVSLVYKGEFASHPSNPQNGWYYRNTSEGKTFVYQSGAWYQMTIDGQDGEKGNDGKDGLSIEYKGELKNPPPNPVKNWTYKDPDNGIVYIYTGLAWEVMTYDGNNGIDGTNGTDGLSVFCTYHDSTTKPSTPTGNGTLNGWHTNWTSSVVWVSQKVSSSATTGTWGTPIKIQGSDGVSAEEIIIQYSKNQSTTTAPTTGWSTSMPSYQEGYYLWWRTRIKWSNSPNYQYSTPVCDESWKVNAQVYSEYKQLRDKFTWIVKSGTSSSTMVLSDDFYSVVTKNIKLSAKNITIEGLVTANSNFKILADGSMEAVNSKFKGDITGGTINIADKFKVDAYGRGTFEEQVFCQNLYASYLRCYDGLQIKTPNNTWSTIAKYDDAAGRIRFGFGAYDAGRNVWYDGGDYVNVRAKERLELTCKSWDAESDTKYSAQLQYYFGTDGNPVITFRPAMNNNMLLGSSSNRWKRIYSTEALNVASDRNAKENISYINPLYQKAAISDITLDDLYSFVKNELYIAKYNYKNSSEDTIGFVAQDLLEVDVDNSKAYDIANIVVNVDEEKNLSYDTGAYVNVLAGALKQAILKIEKLEGLINGNK